jgi:hypothetical protein
MSEIAERLITKNKTYLCERCNNTWNGNQKDGYKLGWRFHGRLTYCPEHKQFQYSLADRDVS